MLLHELKSAGAFTQSLDKFKDSMSLGDVKTALRAAGHSKRIDSDLAKALAFASSYRRHSAELTAGTLSCMFELNIGTKMAVTFGMKHGSVVVTSLAPVAGKDDAAE